MCLYLYISLSVFRGVTRSVEKKHGLNVSCYGEEVNISSVTIVSTATRVIYLFIYLFIYFLLLI